MVSLKVGSRPPVGNVQDVANVGTRFIRRPRVCMRKRKVFFQLAKDEDGYPRFGVESVWAASTRVASEFVIENIPVFAREATIGDVVRVRDHHGRLFSTEAFTSRSLVAVDIPAAVRIERVSDFLRDLETRGVASYEEPILRHPVSATRHLPE